jgi:hypothetical protein
MAANFAMLPKLGQSSTRDGLVNQQPTTHFSIQMGQLMFFNEILGDSLCFRFSPFVTNPFVFLSA